MTNCHMLTHMPNHCLTVMIPQWMMLCHPRHFLEFSYHFINVYGLHYLIYLVNWVSWVSNPEGENVTESGPTNAYSYVYLKPLL